MAPEEGASSPLHQEDTLSNPLSALRRKPLLSSAVLHINPSLSDGVLSDPPRQYDLNG